MPQYVMNKTFDGAEVVQLSPALQEEPHEEAKMLIASFKEKMPKWEDYKSIYSGQGYVMTTGSEYMKRVFPVGIMMAQKFGSRLPIEIWCKDQVEYETTAPIVEDMAAKLDMQITCKRFSDFIDIKEFPNNYLANYLMKSLSMMLSSFEEVIFLDADSVPAQLPDVLLNSEQYRKTGLMLWPDFWSNSMSATLHTILDIGWEFRRTCESGQVVVDKRKHFESLVLASYYNWFGDMDEKGWYRLITLDGMGTGDKDTFVVGAMTLGRPFHFTERPLELLQASYLNGTRWREDTSVWNGAMGQFSPLNQDEIMFMHMHMPKMNFQLSHDISNDLVFARADAWNVQFKNGAPLVEQKLWECIKWVECDSVFTIKNDPRDICAKIKERVAHNELHGAHTPMVAQGSAKSSVNEQPLSAAVQPGGTPSLNSPEILQGPDYSAMKLPNSGATSPDMLSSADLTGLSGGVPATSQLQPPSVDDALTPAPPKSDSKPESKSSLMDAALAPLSGSSQERPAAKYADPEVVTTKERPAAKYADTDVLAKAKASSPDLAKSKPAPPEPVKAESKAPETPLEKFNAFKPPVIAASKPDTSEDLIPGPGQSRPGVYVPGKVED